ncbi:MAG: caspase family protein, partial [Nitrospinota bacterium]|nr:caspase family protein [Nitrospinota bacterium]
NDARSIVSALRKIGFTPGRITLLEDERATGLAVRRAFDHLRLNTKPEDRVFIFFAGHGTTLDLPSGGRMGYLIPVEGTVEALLATGIPMNQVRDMARAIPAKHVFFAIDACFAGLMAARETPKPYKAETVSRLTRGRLRQVLTAGDRDQRAWEEAGHGLFTRRLLEGLDGEADVSPRDGVLTAMELAAYVQGQVTAITQGKQTPIFAKMEGVGQFVFTAPGLGRTARPGTSGLARMRAKLEAERRKLEAEKARLERENLAAEQKRLDVERKRVEKERQRVAALQLERDAQVRHEAERKRRERERERVAV